MELDCKIVLGDTMKEKCKLWLLAIAMGVLLPGVMFAVAEKMIAPKEMDDTAPTATEQISATVQSPADSAKMTIPVLQTDGSVTQMDVDIYITGVILGEMPADFDLEALKAQAVVARTYAYKRHTSGQKHIQGAVCTEPACCQSYCSEEDFLQQGGTQGSVNKIFRAVLSTKDEVLTYNGALIEATYFSCSGGKTEDAQAVWGAAIPYLQSVDSPGEENAAHYKDTVVLSAKEFAALLGISLKGSPASWFGGVTYTPGGGVDTIKIAGVPYKGTVLRQKLGLRSTAFTIMAVGESIHIQTKGFGHRVGMSQYGAEAMAVGGSSYKEILAHYYPGTVIGTYIEN